MNIILLIRKNRGIILIDILLAFSLSILFVAIMTELSIESRKIYEKAKTRQELLDLYDSGSGTILIGPYGNDFFQLTHEVSATSSELSFVEVRGDPLVDLAKFMGKPYCSVDYYNRETIGSYPYFQSLKLAHNTNDQMASITPITLPIDPLLRLTDLEIRNGLAYISADSSRASDPDLVIANISDPANPTIISSLNTGPGLNSIVLVGKRILASAPSTVGQLHIIRLDGLAGPVLEKRYRLDLPFATATPATGSAIAYDGGLVYLGVEKWDGQEFNTIDLLDPQNPIEIGRFETNSKINDILINRGSAYVAASDQNQVWVLDVRDAAHPIQVNSFGPPGWQRQQGKAISFFEDALNIGRTSGGFNYVDEHEIFTFATTSSTTLTSNISADIPGGVYGIVQDRFRIYLATREINKELQIFDKNLTASTSATYSLPIAPQALTCNRDSLYVLAHLAPMIYKINFSRQ